MSKMAVLIRHKPYGPYEKYLKSPLDFLCALLALIVLSWLLAIVALLVRIKLGSPVIFHQKRPGKDAEIFTLCKFRTMTDAKDENGELLPDTERLTRFGKFLRSTSLDELPELWNILKGDMSLVGPRPLAVQYLPYYTEEESHRHDVRPGLTGMAQVHGRNSGRWEDRFAYDTKYVAHITFFTDLKIMFQTVATVLHRNNIGVRGVDSLEDFDVYRKRQIEAGEQTV